MTYLPPHDALIWRREPKIIFSYKGKQKGVMNSSLVHLLGKIHQANPNFSIQISIR